jgi:diazepam-binding inhibitor (GABA receptor modulating acyl-CoA-binding protein)
VNTERPGMFDLKGKAKWDSWKSFDGVSTDEAKQRYIALYEELSAKYGVN